MSNYKFTKVNDLAYDKQTCVNRCGNLGFVFIDHFEKIMQNPNAQDVSHHIGEMEGWFKQVKRLKIKNTKNYLNDDQLINWFFTDGSDFEGLFDDKELTNKYKELCLDILKTRSVRQSFKNILNIE